jgi:cyclopropane fatty-acyl-phospholipid synthase-like methyltransferase
LAQAACHLARVGPTDTIYDLGSGDGPILICALSEFKCRRAVGYELDERLIESSLTKAKAAGVADKLEIRRADLLKADLSPASVITMYLSDRANEALEPAIMYGSK